jgi:hypothetical protein
MPQWLSVVVLLGLGAALLRVAHNGWREGRVRAGNSIRGVWHAERDAHPLAFRFFVGMYYCAGMALCVWGLLVMVGMAPGMRWR